MNKSIILSALNAQLSTAKADAESHYTNVYVPAVAGLTSVVKSWFDINVIEGINDIVLGDDRVTVFPNEGSSYSNRVEFDVRTSYGNDRKPFVRFNSYSTDFDSNEDHANSVYYLQVASACATNFSGIMYEMLNVWMPAMNQLSKAKSDLDEVIWNIEREIRQVESQIAEEAKDGYYKTGVQCKLNSYKSCDHSWEDSQRRYFIVEKQHDIRLQTGRGRWDYICVNEFEVLSYPKAKHAKVVIKYKSSNSEDKFRTYEVNKARFEQFIAEVHEWQSKRAAEKTEAAERRYAEATAEVA